MSDFLHNLAHNRTVAVLLIILAFGAFLRFYGLDNESLANDELSSWKRSSYGRLSDVIELGVRTDVHPPGYQVFLYFIIKIMGDSEIALRIPSVIFGILSILIIYLLGLKIFSEGEALLSAALTSVLWCPVFFSQDARSYSMLLLFTSAAFYFWIEIIMDHREGHAVSKRAVTGYLITSIIACYLHYFGLYLIALQGLFSFPVLIRRRRAMLRVLEIYLLIFLAYIPWLPSMWGQMRGGGSWIQQSGKNIFASFFDFVVFLFNNSAWIGYTALALCLVIVIDGLMGIWRKAGIGNILTFKEAALLLWLVIPFAVAYLVSRYSTPILSTRNLIISLPPAYLLFSRVLLSLCRGLRSKNVIMAVLPVLLLIHLVFSIDYYSGIHKTQFREVVKIVAVEEKRYENSMIIGYVWDPDYINYYLKKHGSSRRIDAVIIDEEDNTNVIESIKSKEPNHIWFIRAARRGDLDQRTVEYIEESYILVGSHPFLWSELGLFARRKDP